MTAIPITVNQTTDWLEIQEAIKVKAKESKRVFVLSEAEYESWESALRFATKTPNTETLSAMQEAEDILAGKVEGNIYNEGDIFKWLEEED